MKFGFIIGKDLSGIPIIFIRCRQMNPKECTETGMKKYGIYMMEEAIRQQGAVTDKFIIIMDFKGASLSNVNFKQLKEVVPLFQVPLLNLTNIRTVTLRECTGSI